MYEAKTAHSAFAMNELHVVIFMSEAFGVMRQRGSGIWWGVARHSIGTT